METMTLDAPIPPRGGLLTLVDDLDVVVMRLRGHTERGCSRDAVACSWEALRQCRTLLTVIEAWDRLEAPLDPSDRRRTEPGQREGLPVATSYESARDADLRELHHALAWDIHRENRERVSVWLDLARRSIKQEMRRRGWTW